jgi:hypothetical protein
MDDELYAEWQKRQPSHEFLAGVPAFRDQNLKRKPARELVQAGTAGLDCRYLNFRRNAMAGMPSPNMAAPVPSSFISPACGN